MRRTNTRLITTGIVVLLLASAASAQTTSTMASEHQAAPSVASDEPTIAPVPAQDVPRTPARSATSDETTAASVPGQDVAPTTASNSPPEPRIAQTIAPESRPGSERDVVGYSKSGFYIEDDEGDYDLRISFVSQFRFEWEGVDEGPDEAAVQLKRFRLRFRGHAFDPEFRYFFQPAFDAGTIKMLDWWVDYGFVPKDLHLRLGQVRRPFSRQFIMPVWRTELVDRSTVDKTFGSGRDIGVVFHNNYESSPTFEWVLGVFNGTGAGARTTGSVEVDPDTGEGSITSTKTTNVPDHFHPMVVGRVGFNVGGIKGYHEGDLEGGPFRLAVGSGVLADFDADRSGDGRVIGTVDALVKAHGFSAQVAVFADFDDTNPDSFAPSYSGLGLASELGYVIVGQFQPVARYAGAFHEEDPTQHEVLGGLSVYFMGHKLKWQTDGGVLVEEAEDSHSVTPRLRTQATFVF